MLLALALGACLVPAHAGSYDDFFVAIKRDNPKAVTELLQRGFDPNTVSPEGLQGLFMALREGSMKVAEVLADWPKTEVEWRSPQDESPLMMASLRGNAALVRKLIQRDAHVAKPGWTALHYAATHGHLEVMKILLEEHAFVDAESPNKTTPLMMAAMYGTTEAVMLLLDSGADPTLRNELGMNAADFARRGERPDAERLVTGAIRATQPKGKW